jgi:hypothetical protein
MIFYFKITKHIQFHIRKFQKKKFCASFQFYFLCIFLVRGDPVSKHEQLLILTGIVAGANLSGQRVFLRPPSKNPEIDQKINKLNFDFKFGFKSTILAQLAFNF